MRVRVIESGVELADDGARLLGRRCLDAGRRLVLLRPASISEIIGRPAYSATG